ncbi:MAG TPA: phosphopantetheine-binding protein, partial [Ktedonobacteraceae bacterium]|nr:phosphopantetheine-binding protein [Ktedonobacteraceae bacterium]
PHIHRAVVSAVGEQSHDRKLVAYVVSKTSDQPTISDLRGFLLTKIPDYMIPGVFVFLDTFPLTPNGKVDRRSLPLPDQAQPAQLATYVAPRTPVEEMLAGILADALEIKRVGVLDDYFMLGGHSLLATQILSRIRDTFKVNLTLQDFFGAPTVAGIASVIEMTMQSQENGQNLSTIRSRDPEVGKL